MLALSLTVQNAADDTEAENAILKAVDKLQSTVLVDGHGRR